MDASAQPWHQRYRPIRALRNYARHKLFCFLEKVFETDDGKRLAAETLKGLLPAAASGLAVAGNDTLPYPELGTAARTTVGTNSRQPIFITARFRSGSTLLWNLFRHVEGVTAYYEPLNERQWFNPVLRGQRIDRSHRGVNDYWREYDGLDVLGRYYQASWTTKHLWMDETFWEPELKQYVQLLIDRAPGRPVLQFNRVDFRLPWLRRNFAEAKIIHLYRHPRDQWCSSLMDVRSFAKDGRVADFEPHDHFYLLPWARDLRYRFPFLNEAKAEHPYQLFYYLWKLSYLLGKKHADCSLAYEHLVATPEQELGQLFQIAGLPTSDLPGFRPLIDRPPAGKWQVYADDAWFRRHESTCESVLAGFLGEEE